MDMLARCIYQAVLEVFSLLGEVPHVDTAVLINAPHVMQGIIARASVLEKENPLRAQAKQIYEHGLQSFLLSKRACSFGQALLSLRKIAQQELNEAATTADRLAIRRAASGRRALL